MPMTRVAIPAKTIPPPYWKPVVQPLNTPKRHTTIAMPMLINKTFLRMKSIIERVLRTGSEVSVYLKLNIDPIHKLFSNYSA